MLDEIEAMGRRLESFQDWGEDWRAKDSQGLLTSVITSKRPLHEIYDNLNLTSPFGNIFSTTVLGCLEESAWRCLVKDGLGENCEEELALIDELAGGLPFYVQMAAAMVWQYDTPEQVRQKFTEQAMPHFQQLWGLLTDSERNAIRYVTDMNRIAEPEKALMTKLQRYGVLREEGQIFSSVFAEFVRGQ